LKRGVRRWTRVAGSVLLDTSAAAGLLRGDQAVSEKLKASDEVYTSIVVIGELLYGARHSTNAASNLEHVAAFAAAIVVLPADQETADAYARIKQALRSKGRPIPDNDLWIAATAIQHGLALMNRDAHFDEIDELVSETW
jgi:tRNA(fMet)-specific endonuclease VapC